MKWAVFNQKGGVGKTSITCNLAASFAKLGRKTLVVDLDAQANATHYLLGDDAGSVTRTVADFFASTLSFKLFKDSLRDTICKTSYENLYVIPSEAALIELQPKLEGRYKIFKLAEAIDATIESEGFEEVFFDTSPALNFYSMSALIAADRVLVPFDCDAFSANAITQIMDVVEEVANDHRPELKVEGIVINQFQSNANLPSATIERLKSKGLRVLEPYLSTSIMMRESHEVGVPLPFFKPNHKLSQEFKALCEGLLQTNAKPDKATSRKKRPDTETNI